jgi:hypothetical protein
MPSLPNLPGSKDLFSFYQQNNDILLITTTHTPVLLDLIESFGLGDEIANDVLVLLKADTPKNKTVLISLCRPPEKKENCGYTALLECDLCGVRQGFFAIFKSLSEDTESLTEECKRMHEFLNEELRKEKRLDAVISRLPVTDYLN